MGTGVVDLRSTNYKISRLTVLLPSRKALEGCQNVPNFDLGDGYPAYLQKRSIVTSMEGLLQLMRASMSKCCYRKAWYKCVKKDS